MSAATRTPRAFVLRSETGLEATVLDWGATLARLRAPGRDARLLDLVLGFDDLAAYQGPHPSLGGVVGRYANRIAGARFTLGGREHRLGANDGPHCLHGGPPGFDRRFWDAEPAGESELLLTLRSPDGDQGFPGRLDVSLHYRVVANALQLAMRLACDAPTVASLASHAYWNLEDGGATPILDHPLAIAAERYTPVDAHGIPTGTITSVAGTPLDFRTPHQIGDCIEALVPERGGYDHNFEISPLASGSLSGNRAPNSGRDSRSSMRPAAWLAAPRSGFTLTVCTTLPGLQLYTGGCFDGMREFRPGVRTPRFGALALETQQFPNAPNEPRFPSARLEPGIAQEHATVFEIGLAA